MAGGINNKKDIASNGEKWLRWGNLISMYVYTLYTPRNLLGKEKKKEQKTLKVHCFPIGHGSVDPLCKTD